DTLDSIGFAHEALGEHEAAIDHYQQSVALFHEIGDPRGEATALIGFGDVQLAVGELDGARASWELALSLVTAMPGGDSGPVRGPACEARRGCCHRRCRWRWSRGPPSWASLSRPRGRSPPPASRCP